MAIGVACLWCGVGCIYRVDIEAKKEASEETAVGCGFCLYLGRFSAQRLPFSALSIVLSRKVDYGVGWRS